MLRTQPSVKMASFVTIRLGHMFVEVSTCFWGKNLVLIMICLSGVFGG